MKKRKLLIDFFFRKNGHIIEKFPVNARFSLN